jgi:hypothetical protein
MSMPYACSTPSERKLKPGGPNPGRKEEGSNVVRIGSMRGVIPLAT